MQEFLHKGMRAGRWPSVRRCQNHLRERVALFTQAQILIHTSSDITKAWPPAPAGGSDPAVRLLPRRSIFSGV